MSGAVFLCLLAPSAWAQDAPAVAEPAQVPLEQLLPEADAENLAKLFMYVHKTYPDLARPTVDLVNAHHPQFWAFGTARLEELARKGDAQLPTHIRQSVLVVLDRVRPALRREVIDFIDARYPLLLQEIQEIHRRAGEADPQAEVMRLLAEKYPTLVPDVRDEILVKHPKVLAEVLNAIAKNWPALFGDVVKQTHRQFPKLARDLFAMAVQKHPEFAAVAGMILRGEMPIEDDEANEGDEAGEDQGDEGEDEDEEGEEEDAEDDEDPDEFPAEPDAETSKPPA